MHESKGRGETLKSSIKKLLEWFINGLEHMCRAAISTRNVEIEEDFEGVIAETTIGERMAQEKKGDKA